MQYVGQNTDNPEGVLFIGNAKNTCLVDCTRDVSKIIRHIVRPDQLEPRYMDEAPPKYYPMLNVLLVREGLRHRIAEAYLNRDICNVPARIYDDIDSFNGITTDGAYYYKDGMRLNNSRIQDYRIAVKWELMHRKYALDEERALAERDANLKNFIVQKNDQV